MADLIDRAALITQINLSQNRTSLGEVCARDINGMEICTLIKEAPAVDAVEVVKCEACKSFGMYSHGRYGFCSHPFGLKCPEPNYFCSCGERRTDGRD